MDIKRSQEVCELEDYDCPDWVDSDLTGEDIEAIQQGGCASGAYMPAVTYSTARDVMNDHGDDVLQFIEDYGCDHFFQLPSGTSWSGIAVHFLSIAVELWAQMFEIIEDDDDDWDDNDEDEDE